MYIWNLINKSQPRASGRDDDHSEHSDDLLSDEELVVSHDMMQEAVVTNVGGRAPPRMSVANLRQKLGFLTM